MTNSGSSANMIAISALTSPLLGDRRLKPGDRVVTTAAGFPTTIAPIIWNKLVPVFVDVQIPYYVPTKDDIHRAINATGAKAIMMAHTMGHPWPIDLDMQAKVWIVEDNCDALGSLYHNHKTGSFGHIATQSFYPAHHITTGEGGMALASEGRLKRALESFRDWGRDCWCEPGAENTCGKRYGWDWKHLPNGYDHKYVYSHLGFNLKSTDIQAAIGVAQLGNITRFTKKRIANYTTLHGLMQAYGLDEFFILPDDAESCYPSWFGFVLTIKDGVACHREDLLAYLAEKSVGTRLLFAGDYRKQPVFRDLMKSKDFHYYQDPNGLLNTTKIMRDTFWIGCWHGLKVEQLVYAVRMIYDFFNEHR
jgi:CDP-6-deoxy-D-xylo-4-hexulose-3-dehydrase